MSVERTARGDEMFGSDGRTPGATGDRASAASTCSSEICGPDAARHVRGLRQPMNRAELGNGRADKGSATSQQAHARDLSGLCNADRRRRGRVRHRSVRKPTIRRQCGTSLSLPLARSLACARAMISGNSAAI